MSVEVAEQEKLRYRDLKGESNYIKDYIAGVVSRFGDSIDEFVLMYLVFEITGSAVWLPLMLGVNKIPTIIFQPLAGAWVEHTNKKKLLFWTDIGRALIVTAIAVLYIMGALNAWVLLLCTFLNSTLEAFNLPAGMAVFSKLISREKYTVAMSLNKFSTNIAQIVGLAMAPVIIAGWGYGVALIVDAATFLISGVLMICLDIKEEEKKENFDMEGYKNNLKEGLSYLRRTKILWRVCILACMINAVLAPISSFQIAYIENMGLGQDVVALSNIMLMIGLGVGAYVFPLLSKYLSRNKLFCTGGLVGVSGYIMFAGLTNLTDLSVLVFCVVSVNLVMGLSISMLLMCITVGFMRNVEESYMARVGAIFNSVATVSLPITAFVLAIMANFISVTQIFLVVGIIGILLFVMLFFDKELKNL